jgi:hypothetical protein
LTCVGGVCGCTAGSCPGCCASPLGGCFDGDTPAACGPQGGTCVPCQPGQQCVDRVCV